MPTPVYDDPEDVKPFDPKGRPFFAPKKKWTELGYDDPVLKAGRWRLFYYQIREADPLWNQPDITDGIIGAVGVDSTRATESRQRDMPGYTSQQEWRDRRYFLDPNIRAIYEKYPISKHHPGLPFRPTGYEENMENKNYWGGYMRTVGFIKEWPGIMPQSWKFMAAPFGEQCHVKTAVCAKYALFMGTAYFLYDAPMVRMNVGWRGLLKHWYSINKITVPIGVAWGAVSCLSCNLRGKDDVWNMFAGGTAIGCAIGLKRGFFWGWYFSIMASIAGTVWYYWIAHEHGMERNYQMGMQNMFSHDPAAFKWAESGSNLAKVGPINW